MKLNDEKNEKYQQSLTKFVYIIHTHKKKYIYISINNQANDYYEKMKEYINVVLNLYIYFLFKIFSMHSLFFILLLCSYFSLNTR